MKRWVQIRPALARSWTDGDYVVSIEERTGDKARSISWCASGWWNALIKLKRAIEEATRREQQEEVLGTAEDVQRYCEHCGREEH